MWIENLIKTIIVPIIVALLTYLLVDRLGEYKKRKNYSRLGIAIIESLLEEVRTGINLMIDVLNAIDTNNELPRGLLPNKSWNGMTTIPDEILLRIIATSTEVKFESFPPRECRIHCKNYFEHMNQNYKYTLDTSINLTKQGQDWQGPLYNLLSNDGSHYLRAAQGVEQMLVDAKKLLEKNVKAIFPK